MANPTLGGITLTGVSSIREDESANIIVLTMPTEDSSETEIFDMLGALRTISVEGEFAGEISAVKSDMNTLLALSTGEQTTTINFISDQTGDSNGISPVKVSSITSNWDLPGNRCSYSIKLFKGV